MKTILYIEDDYYSYELVRKSLRHLAECEVLGADNGIEGIAIAKRATPSLILVDLNLPDIHGSEVIQRIREDVDLLNTPVVVVTGDDTDASYQRCRDLGCEAYLLKPLSRSLLLKTIGMFV